MIIYCASDLMFASKIGGAAEAMGISARPARNRDMLTDRLSQVDDGKPNQPVAAVIVDLDLAEAAFEMIGLARSHSAELAIIAFGSHVEGDALRRAEACGATQAMPRSAFTARLPQLLQSLAGRAPAP